MIDPVAEYLRSQRTLTAAEVAATECKRARTHVTCRERAEQGMMHAEFTACRH